MKKVTILFVSLMVTFSLTAQVWQPVASGTTLKLNSVSFGSDQVGYIGANDSTLLKTMDGGTTWNVQPTQGLQFSATLPDITQVDFKDENVGFAMVGKTQFNGYLFKTIDGGLSWTPEQISMCYPHFSYNFDADNSYVVGASCFGGKTIDKKVNGIWQTSTKYLSWGNEFLRTMTFYDTLYGITAGDSGEVHRTFDGGLSWDTINTFTNEIIWDLEFVNDSTIYGVVDSIQNTLVFSTDSGKTWSEHANSLTFYYPQLKALTSTSQETVIAVGTGSQLGVGIISWGRNNGPFWRVDAVNKPLNNVGMINDSVGIVVGDSGSIFMSTAIINGVKDVFQMESFVLFPNPSKSFFIIQGNTQLIECVSVYDLTGRLLIYSEHKVEQVNVSNLKSGLYKVVIKTQNGRTVNSLVVGH